MIALAGAPVLDAIVRGGLATRRYTAAVVRVERRGAVAFERAYGATGDEPHDVPIAVDTRFDLASLTKPFVATAALHAVDVGKLALDDPISAVLPQWHEGAKSKITPRMLLAHEGGLQSGADYRTLFDANVERYALERELIARPGERVIYSDLGLIALGVALARCFDRSLSSVVQDVALACGAPSFAFRLRGRERDAVPATEFDAWRGRVRGTVHDEKAHLLGGVAGHAGGFGSALDVARLMDVYLAAACGREHAALGAVVSRELAREAIREWGPDATLRRGLGWALKTLDDNSCGPRMSFATFGHTGFTGTCAWADPERDLSVVFLTNAVYYGRRDLRDLRAAVCDAAVEAFA